MADSNYPNSSTGRYPTTGSQLYNNGKWIGSDAPESRPTVNASGNKKPNASDKKVSAAWSTFAKEAKAANNVEKKLSNNPAVDLNTKAWNAKMIALQAAIDKRRNTIRGAMEHPDAGKKK